VHYVPTSSGAAWFKACGEVQAFEPRLSAALYSRWPDRVGAVIAHDEERRWLLLDDAGRPAEVFGDRVDVWPQVLPLYAELQRGEVAHARSHVAHGVPDLRVEALPERYGQLLDRPDLPLDPDEMRRLHVFAPRFAALCDELAAHALPATIQHDDLHYANVYARGSALRVLDWGDASVGHPFASLVVTFRFLEQRDGVAPGDPLFARLRDAYLEPWGEGLGDAFELAMRVGSFALAIAWLRQRDFLAGDARDAFDHWFPAVVRRALARADA